MANPSLIPSSGGEPWEQLPYESNDAYARFLLYRNLGMKRSLIKAYHSYLVNHDGFTGGRERLHIPGQWLRDSSDHFWGERCSAWDIRNLTVYGAKVAVLHVQAITTVAEKNARWASKLRPGDEGWSDLVTSMKLVSDFLTPEVVRGIEARGKRARSAVQSEPDRSSVE